MSRTSLGEDDSVCLKLGMQFKSPLEAAEPSCAAVLQKAVTEIIPFPSGESFKSCSDPVAFANLITEVPSAGPVCRGWDNGAFSAESSGRGRSCSGLAE